MFLYDTVEDKGRQKEGIDTTEMAYGGTPLMTHQKDGTSAVAWSLIFGASFFCRALF